MQPLQSQAPVQLNRPARSSYSPVAIPSAAISMAGDSLSLRRVAQDAGKLPAEQANPFISAGISALDFLKRHVPAVEDLSLKYSAKQTRKNPDTGPVIQNEGKLNDRLFRGAFPAPEGFKTLKNQGFDTVINLMDEDNSEQPIVQKLGMKAIHIPEDGLDAPSNQQTLRFLSAATDPANGKVFFHCSHGADRTGTMAAAYRIAHDGWSVDQAIAELPTYHFHASEEQAKIKYLKSFSGYWESLSQSVKDQVLHVRPHL